MGSCISKCTRSKKRLKEDDLGHVHDKLVISQDPVMPRVSPRKTAKMAPERPLSPPPSSPSGSSSFSSFSCSTNSKSCAVASSTSSSSSSVPNVKDRSFSNEFLWSCVKDNPHIIGLRSPMITKEESTLENQTSLFYLSPLLQKPKRSIQEKPVITVSTPKKRARASSPTLVRQKSFRRDHSSLGPGPAPDLIHNGPGLRSPSPSRRFTGPAEKNRSFSTTRLYDNSCRRSPIVSKGINNNAVNSATSSVRRESFRTPNASPARDSTVKGSISSRKDTLSQQVCAKNGGVAVGDIQGLEMDTIMEDINNPLIALDCFIFL